MLSRLKTPMIAVTTSGSVNVFKYPTQQAVTLQPPSQIHVTTSRSATSETRLHDRVKVYSHVSDVLPRDKSTPVGADAARVRAKVRLAWKCAETQGSSGALYAGSQESEWSRTKTRMMDAIAYWTLGQEYPAQLGLSTNTGKVWQVMPRIAHQEMHLNLDFVAGAKRSAG